MHTLAFMLDPFFNQMRKNIRAKYTGELGEDILHLGKGTLEEQCNEALMLLSKGDETLYSRLHSDFVMYSVRPGDRLSDEHCVAKYRPHILWAGSGVQRCPPLAGS